MTRCADMGNVKLDGLKKSRLKQSIFDQNRSLIEELSKRDFSPKLAMNLLHPYLESIVTSLQKVGYISKPTPSYPQFFAWMKSSKEWQHIQDISSRNQEASFNLNFYLLRALLRYLNSTEVSVKAESNEEQNGLVSQIFKYFENEKKKLSDLNSTILSLYFEGLTTSEISYLIGKDEHIVEDLLENTKESIVGSLSERIKKHVP